MMETQSTDPDMLQHLLMQSEAAFYRYRNGQASLQTVYQRLTDFLDELEQYRLKHPQEASDFFFLQRYDVYETAAALAYGMGRVRESFDHFERTRARALLNQTLNKVAIDPKRLKDRSLLQREATLSQRVKDLTRQRNLETQLWQARRELLEVRNAIKEQDPAFAALRGVTPASLDDVTALLDQKSALVVYGITEERLIIFIATNQGLWSEHVDLSRSQLSGLVRQYREQMDHFAAQPRDIILETRLPTTETPPRMEKSQLDSLARRLYDILIRPIEVHLQGKSRLGVVPDGDLHSLPFQALLDEHIYLIERYALWYSPSISLLDLCDQRQRRSKGNLLALGNPDLGNSDLELPFAEQEVWAITHQFGEQPHVGSNANLLVLKTLWEQADILHLACHAEWNEAQPEFSALLLSPGQEDNGRLEVHELFAIDHDLPLSQVTLSACQTSLGTGKDLIGLTTGFLYAGAPAVVASLWRVDDFSTSELMLEFYQNLVGTDRAKALPASDTKDMGLSDGNLMETDRVEALSAAQLKLLRSREHAHPYFWAAFKLVGSPLPISSDRTHSISAFNLIHQWAIRSQDDYLIAPVTSQGMLYATWLEQRSDSGLGENFREYAICGISVADRQVRWKHDLPRGGGEAFCWRPGLVHVNAASKVYGLGASDGKVLWERETGTPFFQSLRYDGEQLYQGGRSRLVYALQPATGKIIWEYQLARPAHGLFAVGMDHVFVSCNDRYLYALDARNGKFLWKCDLGWAEPERYLAWVSEGCLHTELGDFLVETGEWIPKAPQAKQVVSDDHLLLEYISTLPRSQHLELDSETCLYIDHDLVFVGSADRDRGAFLSMFSAEKGSLLRRYQLTRRNNITGISRNGELVVVGAGDGTLHGFSIEMSKKIGGRNERS